MCPRTAFHVKPLACLAVVQRTASHIKGGAFVAVAPCAAYVGFGLAAVCPGAACLPLTSSVSLWTGRRTGIVSVMNSLRRLGEFLSEPELPSAAHLPWALQQQAELPAEKLLRSSNADGEVFRATDAELSWGVDRTASTLGGLNFSIKKGKINEGTGEINTEKGYDKLSCSAGSRLCI